MKTSINEKKPQNYSVYLTQKKKSIFRLNLFVLSQTHKNIVMQFHRDGINCAIDRYINSTFPIIYSSRLMQYILYY